MFERGRTSTLADGRQLIVTYEGEAYGWMAYVPGPAPPPVLADTCEGAIACYLGCEAADLPASLQALAAKFERELQEARRYECRCCGHRTLLNRGHYEICPVCRWEDDPVADEDEISGPNHVSLRQARRNYQAFGASTQQRLSRARRGRDSE